MGGQSRKQTTQTHPGSACHWDCSWTAPYLAVRLTGTDTFGGVPVNGGAGTPATGYVIVALDPNGGMPTPVWVFQAPQVGGTGNLAPGPIEIVPSGGLAVAALLTGTNQQDVGGVTVGGQLGSFVAVVGR